MPIKYVVKDADGNPMTISYRDIDASVNSDDKFFCENIRNISQYTMSSKSGLDSAYSTMHTIKYISENNIEGDIVECGVWRGGLMMMAASYLHHLKNYNKKIYLYDTFAGMTEPDEVDVDFGGREMKPIWQNAKDRNELIGFGGTLEEIQENMRQTQYPEDKLVFVKGDILETIPETIPEKIAFLRLDTDWYKSTLHELEHLYPLLSSKGIMVIDDYGWCKGSRKATDEYFGKLPFKPFLFRLNETIRIVVKP